MQIHQLQVQVEESEEAREQLRLVEDDNKGEEQQGAAHLRDVDAVLRHTAVAFSSQPWRHSTTRSSTSRTCSTKASRT